jgi:uncharacterized membrane protein
MNKRLPLWVRRVMYNLRGGFLVRPLTIALGLGCAGALLSWLEETVPAVGDWVPPALFPSHADPQVAQVILAGIAGSIMTVVSIVFAILLMTLTLASMQFSPRIIVSFVRDGVTQWTLGIFLGTFSYCMAALPAARSLPRPFAPVLTVCGAMLLALICVGWLLFFIHHITQSISVSYIVDRIASETESMIDETMPSPYRAVRLETPGLLDANTWDHPLLSGKSGYIRFVDIPRLVALAKSHGVKVRMFRRVGQFVPAGTPLLMLSKANSLSPETAEEFRNAVDLGPSRTLQQDIEFGILQIVDIALKAISPAVNDPSTGITCVDQLSRILIRFAAREPAPRGFYDPPSILRVSIDRTDFDHMLESAFEQIRMYAKGDVAVSLRLLRALGDIASATPDQAVRATIYERGKRIVKGCAEKLGEEELRSLRLRLSAWEEHVEHQASSAVPVRQTEGPRHES